MNILEFNHYTFEKKCEVIATEGAFITFRYVENMKIYLYAIEEFFVEVSFSPYHHKVIGIDSFNNIDLLNPYLEFINIDQLTF